MENPSEIIPPRVAIIGAGFSGTLVAANLLKRARGPLALTLIERRTELGKGIAYSTPTLCHLLNVPAGNMSAFPDDPTHFVRWIDGNREEWESVAGTALTRESFVPRKLYGLYLQDILGESIAETGRDVRFERVQDEAIALEGKPGDYRIVMRSGKTVAADIVVVALGNFLPAHPRVETPQFYQSSVYFQDPWAPRAVSELTDDKPVLLLGTGLTMVDLTLMLQEQGHVGGIHAISRHGYLPESHRKVEPYLPLFPTQPPEVPTARLLLHALRGHLGAAEAAGANWRAVIDGLRPHNQEIWKRLELVEKKRFLRHLKSRWDVHRHRIAPQIGQELAQLRAAGTLQIHAGRLLEFHEVRDGVDVIFEKRGCETREVIRVQRVINCTGPAYHALRLAHPLLAQMHDQGWVRAHPLMGLDAASNGALVGKDGQASRSLFTLGSVLTGVLWETIAVPELRGQAQATADTVLAELTMNAALGAQPQPNSPQPPARS